MLFWMSRRLARRLRIVGWLGPYSSDSSAKLTPELRLLHAQVLDQDRLQYLERRRRAVGRILQALDLLQLRLGALALDPRRHQLGRQLRHLLGRDGHLLASDQTRAAPELFNCPLLLLDVGAQLRNARLQPAVGLTGGVELGFELRRDIGLRDGVRDLHCGRWTLGSERNRRSPVNCQPERRRHAPRRRRRSSCRPGRSHPARSGRPAHWPSCPKTPARMPSARTPSNPTK